MKKNFGIILAAGAAVALTGCGKKMNQFAADYFSTNPNPLEVVGTSVPATVTGNVPQKFFVKDATVTVTPVLVYGSYQTAGAPVAYQGEKVRGNNPVVSYANGGTVTIPVNYPYTPEMIKSELYLDFAVAQGKKQYALPRVKVADGVIATAAFASAESVTPAIAPDKFQRIINEKYAADIRFLINQANIRPVELRTAQMEAFNKDLVSVNSDTSKVIKEINISSYASPDGSYAFNTQLAEKREANTTAYVEKQLKKDKITEFGELTAQFTPEDWEGFQKLVAQSNIQDKDLILNVLSMYSDPEQREREIRNLSDVFEQLAEQILPQLRYSRITASIDVIGKSDAEIMRLLESNPSQLNVEEILYAATLTNDNERKLAIYDKAARLFPNDYRTFNNLGMAQYVAGDYSAAQANFSRAASMGNHPEPQMNLGLIEMLNGNYNKANQYFGSAAGVDELGNALGVYYLKQGDAAAAVNAFGSSRTNNAALAQILARDYSRAKTTLASVETPDATTYYLMAILGARTNNENMLVTNLRQAVRLDSSLAKRAVKDLEFANYNLSRALN